MSGGSRRKGRNTRCARSRSITSRISIKDREAVIAALKGYIGSREEEALKSGGYTPGAEGATMAAESLLEKIVSNPNAEQTGVHLTTGSRRSDGRMINHRDYMTIITGDLAGLIVDPAAALRACGGKDKDISRTLAAAAKLQRSMREMQGLAGLLAHQKDLEMAGLLDKGSGVIDRKARWGRPEELELLYTEHRGRVADRSKPVLDLWEWRTGGREAAEENMSYLLLAGHGRTSTRTRAANAVREATSRAEKIADMLQADQAQEEGYIAEEVSRCAGDLTKAEEMLKESLRDVRDAALRYRSYSGGSAADELVGMLQEEQETEQQAAAQMKATLARAIVRTGRQKRDGTREE